MREIVEDTARANAATRVTRVRLEIGALAQVEVQAMHFAFEVVKQGSMAQTAQLEIVQVDGSAWCMACSTAVTVAQRGEACPHCGSHQLQITGGDRMRVMDIDIE